MPPPSSSRPGEGVTLEGGVEQLTTPDRHYDKTFEMEIGTFAGKARFAQRVKLSVPESSVKAQIEWMLCDDTSCMPPDDTELTIAIPAGAAPGIRRRPLRRSLKKLRLRRSPPCRKTSQEEARSGR